MMKILYGFLILLFLVACEAENEQDLFPPPPTPPMSDTTGGMMGVSFSRDIAPLISTNCAISACHGGPTFPSMSNYNEIKAQTKRIRARAVNEMTMPPAERPDLTPKQIDDLKAWLDAGAPNN